MTLSHIATGDGCKIAYRWDGPADAPVLMLSNSLGTSLAMWEPQIAAFAGKFRVLRYDNRGHGESDASPGGYSIDRLGRDVIELLDDLGVEKIDFCGLSKGGVIGQWLGIREPQRIRRLILANTASYMGPPSAWDARIALVRAEGLAPLGQGTIERWFTQAFRDRHPDVIAPVLATLLSTSAEGYAGCCAAIRDTDMRRTVSLIAAPTLVIGGAADPSTPPPQCQALADAIAGAEFSLLQAAHLSNIEQARAFTDVCLGFLK